MDEVLMFSLTDLNGGDDEVLEVSRGESRKSFVPSVSLLKRRRSQHINPLKPLKLSVRHGDARDSSDSGYDSTKEFSSPRQVPETPLSAKSESPAKASPKINWQRAVKKISSLKDPWEKFFLADLPVERAKRHRYNALRKAWTVDEVNVKMETESFNHGAMRECFRLKKLSTFSVSQDWRHAMNYVAKRYMQTVDTAVYYEDVRLQMDAKLWGEEFNRHRPPKQVDIFQISILEFIDRPGKPLYHLEHFIEGKYIKYNSNSGFVEDHVRFTPQAFSHFTFERSGHELIVVDIQGVDDLWTDPQIHTSDGQGYGDGNLGVNGMALFFHSHVCNSICEGLGLSKFDLAPSEIQLLTSNHPLPKSSALTIVRGQEEMCVSASPKDRSNLHAFLLRCRTRTISSTSVISEHSDRGGDDSDDVHHHVGGGRHRSNTTGTGSDDDDDDDSSPSSSGLVSPTSSELLSPPVRIARRQRYVSESDDTASTADEDEKIRQMRNRNSRPSCINMDAMSHEGISVSADSVLGRIHHSLALYHEISRFGPDIDWQAAGYHERQAAELGVLDAMITVAKIALGLPHELLANATLDLDVDTGVTFMLRSALAGDRSAMIYMAEAFASGNGLGSRPVDHQQAVDWFTRAIVASSQSTDTEDFDATMDYPLYQLQAKVADMYMLGGPGLAKDPQKAADMYNEAAESATNAMKGRLANTYYSKAEEALAECEE